MIRPRAETPPAPQPVTLSTGEKPSPSGTSSPLPKPVPVAPPPRLPQPSSPPEPPLCPQPDEPGAQSDEEAWRRMEVQAAREEISLTIENGTATGPVPVEPDTVRVLSDEEAAALAQRLQPEIQTVLRELWGAKVLGWRAIEMPKLEVTEEEASAGVPPPTGLEEIGEEDAG